MESKQNKNSPKKPEQKTTSPPINLHPFKIKNESSPSPPSNNNNKFINIKLKSPKKEENTEKKEEKPDFKKIIEENMSLDFDEAENFNPLFFKELNYFPPIIEEKEISNDKLASSLKKWKQGMIWTS